MAIVALYIVNVIIAQKFGQDRKMPLSAPNSFLAFLILMSHASSTDFKVDSVCLVIATFTLSAASPTFFRNFQRLLNRLNWVNQSLRVTKTLSALLANHIFYLAKLGKTA